MFAKNVNNPVNASIALHHYFEIFGIGSSLILVIFRYVIGSIGVSVDKKGSKVSMLVFPARIP